MNKNTGIIIGVVALIVIIGGTYAAMSTKENMIEQDSMVAETAMTEQNTMMNEEKMEDKAMEEGGAMMEDKVIQEPASMMKGSYEAYSPDKLARAATGDVVLFFHASWCPSCRGLNSDIEANMNATPAGVSILKVDYDSETELKKKYGVTYQHTLVQVDKDGNLIKKWSGSPKLASLVSQIQ